MFRSAGELCLDGAGVIVHRRRPESSAPRKRIRPRRLPPRPASVLLLFVRRRRLDPRRIRYRPADADVLRTAFLPNDLGADLRNKSAQSPANPQAFCFNRGTVVIADAFVGARKGLSERKM